MKLKYITLIGMLAASSASAATFLSSGDITDGAGTTLGTWTFASAGTTGFNGVNTTVGATGVEFAYQPNTASPDTLAAQITITAAAGYNLDSITISQSVYSNTTGDNGIANQTTNYSVTGYTGGFTTSDVDNQISTPGVSGGNLEWTSGSDIDNNLDSWSVTLDDVTSGSTISYQETHATDLFQEWVSFDANFSPVPEPSSTALLGLGGLALLARRRR